MKNTKTGITLTESGIHVMVVNYSNGMRADRHISVPDDQDNTEIDFSVVNELIAKANEAVIHAITYNNIAMKTGNTRIMVRLDGKPIGTIKNVEGGFQYFSNGQKTGGDIFETILGVKTSLHSD